MSTFDDSTGKISPETFKEVIFSRCGSNRKEVIHPPQFGVDTSVVDIGGGQVLVISSDPISLVPPLGLKASAWLSVHLLANDMATSGFAPRYAQFVLNLPAHLTLEDFREYWDYIHRFCEEIGVAITGGHTGKVEGQHSTVSGGGTMFLIAPREKVVTSNRAHPGDLLVVTKEAALTATSILALSFPETVREKLGPELHRQACDNFYRTSCLKEALGAVEALVPNEELTAMHDATEGGILGAVYEMARASGCGFLVHEDRIPAGEAVTAAAEVFDIDPHLCVAAGSMVMAVKPGCEKKLIDHLGAMGIEATAIGELSGEAEGWHTVKEGEKTPFRFSGKDPYWDAFFNAIKAGWK